MADGKARKIDNTPTWAIALVLTVFFILGFIILFIFEGIEKLLKKKGRKPLIQTLDKVKEEFMLLGCISLLLTVFQYEVEKICITSGSMDKWNPCPVKHNYSDLPAPSPAPYNDKLRAYYGICNPGYNSVVSAKVLHILHVYIFVLACSHVIYTLLVLLFSTLKMRFWKKYELEAQTANPDHIREISQQLTVERNQSFVRHHTADPLSRNKYLVWIVCFFRQFGWGVTRSDYLSLRQGFISTHGLTSSFNFHKYIMRALVEDFPKMVGITPVLCAIVVLIMLFNVNGAHLFFWVSLVPALLIVLVGTKLQHVIATLALDSAGISHHGRFRGGTVKPRDELFWFNKPGLILFLIQYTLFQTAFETATVLGIYWSVGFDSCLVEKEGLLISRIAIALLSLLLCAYSTLPSYAIVAQMGSHYKGAIFHDEVQDRLKKWRKDAKKRVKEGSDSEGDSTHGRGHRFEDESTIDRQVQGRVIHEDEDHDRYDDGLEEEELGVSGRYSRDWYHMDNMPPMPGSDRYARSISVPVRNTQYQDRQEKQERQDRPERPLLPEGPQAPEVEAQVHRYH